VALDDEYAVASLSLSNAIEEYAALDLYDPQRVKVCV
jgi:hypothetical protein